MVQDSTARKAALITGANNPHGIGAAIARAFARNGIGVFLHGFRQDRAGTLANEPGGPGSR